MSDSILKLDHVGVRFDALKAVDDVSLHVRRGERRVIIGPNGAGKTTLFNAITRTRKAEAANYPFCTIDPNVGVVSVPDARLNALQKIAKTGVVIPAAIEFVDIAGLVKGASQGEGLGNKFLTHVREVDAIVQVVRCFEDADVHHVAGSVDPVWATSIRSSPSSSTRILMPRPKPACSAGLGKKSISSHSGDALHASAIDWGAAGLSSSWLRRTMSVRGAVTSDPLNWWGLTSLGQANVALAETSAAASESARRRTRIDHLLWPRPDRKLAAA